MVEAHMNDPDAGYWGYLINPDKSAAPHLEQLCLGLARKICELEPGPPRERLTPRRLAAFYRSVGGNLDALFLRTTESGLSFLYRTIGCFHSLEPATNPFRTPSLPCLTPEGFVKWQTVQLLLCPDEHVKYLQKAVQVYEVPRPDGGIFPRSIPTESFPNKADAEMEDWHKHVTSQLNQESYVNRLKNSPYQSPYATDRPDGYFQPIPKIRRPSRSSRPDSRDQDRPDFNSRRSSEPDFSSPPHPAGHARNQHGHPQDARIRATSATRPVLGSRQRSATTGHPIRPNGPGPAPRQPHDHPPSAYFRGQYPERPGRIEHGRTPSGSSMDESSAEDASSEDSRGQRRSRTSRVASSLLSVLPFGTSKRRSQSHDASAYLRARRSPRREPDEMTPPPRASTEAVHSRPTSVRFKQDMFDSPAAASAPESGPRDKRPNSAHRHDLRYARNPGLTDPVSPVNYNLTRETSSGSGSENRSQYDMPFRQQRKPGASVRTTTHTGVRGRKYASIETNGAPVLPPRDQQTRYSLAV